MWVAIQIAIILTISWSTKSSGANGRTHCKCKLSSWDHFARFGRPALLMTAINNSFGKSFCTNMIFLTAEQSARTDAFSELSFMLLVHLYKQSASIRSFSGYFWGKICEWQERMDSWTLGSPPPPRWHSFKRFWLKMLLKVVQTISDFQQIAKRTILNNFNLAHFVFNVKEIKRVRCFQRHAECTSQRPAWGNTTHTKRPPHERNPRGPWRGQTLGALWRGQTRGGFWGGRAPKESLSGRAHGVSWAGRPPSLTFATTPLSQWRRRALTQGVAVAVLEPTILAGDVQDTDVVMLGS